MSGAQVVNTGIVGATPRVLQSRAGVASSSQYVDPLWGSFAPSAHDQAPGFDDGSESFETPRRRRRYGSTYDHVVSFGGVLVSREVGAAIMKEQIAQSSREPMFMPVEAERSVAIYEFNQSLMGAAEPVTAMPPGAYANGEVFGPGEAITPN